MTEPDPPPSHHEACPWPWDPVAWPDTFNDPDLLVRVQKIAQDILWRASGRRYGLCQRIIRPTGPSCTRSTYLHSGMITSVNNPALIDGVWRNCGGCGCLRDCHCGTAGDRQVRLPGPAQEIVSVMVDNVALPATAYVIQDHQWLVRVDGDAWPTCQDLSLPEDAVGTFIVTYMAGLPLSPAGVYAYGLYAEELYKLFNGQTCRLPANVEGVFRQGMNIDLADANLDLLSSARTGIPHVDAWLGAVNPYRLHESARVYSPDLPRPRTVTFP